MIRFATSILRAGVLIALEPVRQAMVRDYEAQVEDLRAEISYLEDELYAARTQPQRILPAFFKRGAHDCP